MTAQLSNLNYLLCLPLIGFLLIFLMSLLTRISLLKQIKQLNILACILSLLAATITGFIYFTQGTQQILLAQFMDFDLSLRVDSVSFLMYSMIAIIALVIFRYSHRYLEGDPRHSIFLGRLALTLASVQTLVIAGDLITLCVAWLLTSLALHQLLIYYKHRPRAVSAARKKFIVARMGDVFLFGAALLLYIGYNTTNLEAIFIAIKAGNHQYIELAAAFLALAAIFKSAQFPMFSWLLEVMETPTPVSALLHAGLLNAGPFLIIRMAYVMDAAQYAPFILMVVGGFTALCGSIIYMTQSSIKTALAYSSISHMGFSLFSCGLGIFPAAMLHLVAHSFYKAHAFLSSGSIIEWFKAHKNERLQRAFKPVNIVLGIVATFIIYSAAAYFWGLLNLEHFGLFIIGAIIATGSTKLLVNVIDAKDSKQLLLPAITLCILVALSFFVLEGFSSEIIASDIPEKLSYALPQIVFASIFLVLFFITMALQFTGSAFSYNPFANRMLIYFKNGLYINAYFDRLVRALHIQHEPFDYSEYHIKEQAKKLKQLSPLLKKNTVNF